MSPTSPQTQPATLAALRPVRCRSLSAASWNRTSLATINNELVDRMVAHLLSLRALARRSDDATARPSLAQKGGRTLAC